MQSRKLHKKFNETNFSNLQDMEEGIPKSLREHMESNSKEEDLDFFKPSNSPRKGNEHTNSLGLYSPQPSEKFRGELKSVMSMSFAPR